ncbi:MAG TPA: DUF5106 domain-containing protein, partial [Chitinophagaceae bacterium]|nr:DUF5106 domain-containing protein [Chitinophagaceae bacterium]
MKKVLVAILLGITFFFATYSLKAKSGYTIHVTIRNAKDSMLQLCHYNGRPGMVNIDTSIKIKPGARSECTLKSDKHLVGGLYVLLFKNKRSQMELLLNDGDEIWVEYDFDQPVESATVRGTGECADYLEYLHFLGPYNQKFKQAEEEKRKAKTHADSLLVKEKTKQLNKEMDNYRDAYAKKHPESFMAKLFKASAYKEIPDAIKGKQEKEQQFIREHIWDDFDFNDERLAHTPFTENKLANYLSVIPQQADSINAASDELLSRMKNARALYNQTVDWMVRSQENVKASFGDDCFIYIVEKYYLNGKADWISDSIRNSYQKKIALLSRNVIGSKASDFNVMNDKDQPVSLNSLLP